MEDIENLTTNEGDAPRVVMYIDGQDIMIAYLVADAEIRIQILQPTMEKIIVGLFASYYVWQSWDLVAHFEPISESTPTVPLLPLVS